MTRTLAHISDLHIGRDAPTDEAARRLCASLIAREVDLVLLTGDVTHRGKREELALFASMYAPLLETGRLVLVPGNHDRMGHDLAVGLMDGTRVHVVHRPGLFIVRLDSTAPHNRSSIASHGVLSPADIDAVDVALDGALPDALVVLMLHHHLLPLPEDRFTEKIANFLGWPYAAELPLGRQLLERIQGKCDLVLHGHRHAASELHLRPTARRPLHVYNAGSSGVLGWVRLVSHRAGALLSASWIQTDRPELTPRLPAPARAENAVHSAGERTAASPLTDP